MCFYMVFRDGFEPPFHGPKPRVINLTILTEDKIVCYAVYLRIELSLRMINSHLPNTLPARTQHNILHKTFDRIPVLSSGILSIREYLLICYTGINSVILNLVPSVRFELTKTGLLRTVAVPICISHEGINLFCNYN